MLVLVVLLLVLGEDRMVRAYGGGVTIVLVGGVDIAEELEVDAELACWNDRG